LEKNKETEQKTEEQSDTEEIHGSMEKVFTELDYCESSLNDLKQSIKLHLSHRARNASLDSKEKNHHDTCIAKCLIRSLSIEIQHIDSLFELGINTLSHCGQDAKEKPLKPTKVRAPFGQVNDERKPADVGCVPQMANKNPFVFGQATNNIEAANFNGFSPMQREKCTPLDQKEIESSNLFLFSATNTKVPTPCDQNIKESKPASLFVFPLISKKASEEKKRLEEYQVEKKKLEKDVNSSKEKIKVAEEANEKLEEELSRLKYFLEEERKRNKQEPEKLYDAHNEKEIQEESKSPNHEIIQLQQNTKATTLNFNDLEAVDDKLVPNGHFGLNYTGLWVKAAPSPLRIGKSPGFKVGCISPPNVAFNSGGGPMAISSIGSSTFTINSLCLTPAKKRESQVEVTFEGFNSDGTKVSCHTISLASPENVENVAFNKGFTKLVELRISTSIQCCVVIDNIEIAHDN